jgi:chemosensory pili system protein ChpA (sensor histidine kinase/response regulator)
MNDVVLAADLSALSWVHGELRRSLEMAHKFLRRYLKEAQAGSGSDVDAVDPAVLRNARTQLHQSVGALELVDLPAAADLLRASEAAVQRMVTRPALVTTAAVESIEAASFALLDLLARQLAGKPVSPVMLFPQYRAVQLLAGADRVHPADLWKIDWQWRDLPADALAEPRAADDAARAEMEMLSLALMRPSAASQTLAEGAGSASHEGMTRMSDLCANLGAGARAGSGAEPEPRAATLWQVAAAVFEAQAQGLLPEDVYAKRLASRLLAQLRMRAQGQRDVSDRLAQDLLFFCSHAQAPSAARPAPRLQAVRTVWRLEALPTGDYEKVRLGRFDPAHLALARKRVAAAKDAWSAVAGAEMHRLPGLNEQFALVGESLQKLLPEGTSLAHALQMAVAQTVAGETAPAPALAMEVATATLYLDATLEDGEFDDPELPSRVQALAQRIEAVRVGQEPQPLDSWMEELYRRVSDRQTMGSVVQELRASLSEIEKQIDQYFRDRSQPQLLLAVPGQLSAMRGVLSVLGMDHASAAAAHMRHEVDALAALPAAPASSVPHAETQAGFDRLAENLGALSFLIDMLSVQPQLAKAMFRFDADSGKLNAVMGRVEPVAEHHQAAPAPAPASAFSKPTSPLPRVAAPTAPAPLAAPAVSTVPLTHASLPERLRALAQAAQREEIGDQLIAEQAGTLVQQAAAAEQSELARLLGRVQRVLQDKAGADAAFRRTVRAELVQAVQALSPAPVAAPAAPSAPVPPPVAVVAPGETGLEDDAEMREIFIEEARDVVTEARDALSRLEDDAEDAGGMTVLRRSFHTLKGSSRMVGLKEFGEAAWACEQLYNARLASAPRMDAALRSLSADALDYLWDWADAIESGGAQGAQGHHQAAAVVRAADALRLEGRTIPIAGPIAAGADAITSAPLPATPAALDLPLELPSEVPAATAVTAEDSGNSITLPPLLSEQSLRLRVPGLPSSADLDLSLPSLSPLTLPMPTRMPAASELSFDLDLSAFDPAPQVSPSPAAAMAPVAEEPDLLLDFDSAPAAHTLCLSRCQTRRSSPKPRRWNLMTRPWTRWLPWHWPWSKRRHPRRPRRPQNPQPMRTQAPHPTTNKCVSSARCALAFRCSTSTSTRPTNCRAVWASSWRNGRMATNRSRWPKAAPRWRIRWPAVQPPWATATCRRWPALWSMRCCARTSMGQVATVKRSCLSTPPKRFVACCTNSPLVSCMPCPQICCTAWRSMSSCLSGPSNQLWQPPMCRRRPCRAL